VKRVHQLQTATELFNRQAFFESHEVLEELWRSLPPGPEKTFLQGMIQIAVGFLHLQNRNFVGARNKLQSGLEKLEFIQQQATYQPPIALSSFIQDCQQALTCLLTLGPECLAEFPARHFPQIQPI
jgi:predicted metal-dependent hydrolase